MGTWFPTIGHKVAVSPLTADKAKKIFLSGTKHPVKQRQVSRSMNTSSTSLRKPKTPNTEIIIIIIIVIIFFTCHDPQNTIVTELKYKKE